MANSVIPSTLGIDVSKDELVIHVFESEDTLSIDNEPDAIRRLFKQFQTARIAIEPTSTYHLGVIECAIEQDFQVFLVNPRQLVHYRDAVNVRNKTDVADAYLLARFLDRERDQLRPFTPQHAKASRLWALIKRRGFLARTRTQIRQSFKGISDFSTRHFFSEIEVFIERIDKHIMQLINDLQWSEHYRRCLSIPGIGHANASALVAAFHRGAFASSDAFICFIGLDVRIRESGRFKGKRKLTKRGEAELRRLLYCAAPPARRHAAFDDYYHKQLDKGLSKTAANVILSRKLARIAFALMSKQETFKP